MGAYGSHRFECVNHFDTSQYIHLIGIRTVQMIKDFYSDVFAVAFILVKGHVCWSHTGSNETQRFCLLSGAAFCAAYVEE